MAQTEHLPIYKASYDLCLYLEQIVKNFSRTRNTRWVRTYAPGRGMPWGCSCAANFAWGSAVTLVAVPDAGSTFAGWSRKCGGPGNPDQISITINDNQSCTATFNTQ